MTVEIRENQHSEAELIYMLRRFREEYRIMEAKKRAVEHELGLNNQRKEIANTEIEKLKAQNKFLESKNQILLNKFKTGFGIWERITGKIKY